MTAINNINLIEGEMIEDQFQLETDSYILTNKRLFYVNYENGVNINNPLKNISSIITSVNNIPINYSVEIERKSAWSGLACLGTVILWAFLFGDLGDVADIAIYMVLAVMATIVYPIGYYVAKIIFSIMYRDKRQELLSVKVLLKDGNILMNNLHHPNHAQKLKLLETKLMKHVLSV